MQRIELLCLATLTTDLESENLKPSNNYLLINYTEFNCNVFKGSILTQVTYLIIKTYVLYVEININNIYNIIKIQFKIQYFIQL